VQLLAHHFCFRPVLLQVHVMLPAWVVGENVKVLALIDAFAFCGAVAE
jgi:hypothetical protein